MSRELTSSFPSSILHRSLKYHEKQTKLENTNTKILNDINNAIKQHFEQEKIMSFIDVNKYFKMLNSMSFEDSSLTELSKRTLSTLKTIRKQLKKFKEEILENCASNGNTEKSSMSPMYEREVIPQRSVSVPTKMPSKLNINITRLETQTDSFLLSLLTNKNFTGSTLGKSEPSSFQNNSNFPVKLLTNDNFVSLPLKPEFPINKTTTSVSLFSNNTDKNEIISSQSLLDVPQSLLLQENLFEQLDEQVNQENSLLNNVEMEIEHDKNTEMYMIDSNIPSKPPDVLFLTEGEKSFEFEISQDEYNILSQKTAGNTSQTTPQHNENAKASVTNMNEHLVVITSENVSQKNDSDETCVSQKSSTDSVTSALSKMLIDSKFGAPPQFNSYLPDNSKLCELPLNIALTQKNSTSPNLLFSNQNNFGFPTTESFTVIRDNKISNRYIKCQTSNVTDLNTSQISQISNNHCEEDISQYESIEANSSQINQDLNITNLTQNKAKNSYIISPSQFCDKSISQQHHDIETSTSQLSQKYNIICDLSQNESQLQSSCFISPTQHIGPKIVFTKNDYSQDNIEDVSQNTDQYLGQMCVDTCDINVQCDGKGDDFLKPNVSQNTIAQTDYTQFEGKTEFSESVIPATEEYYVPQRKIRKRQHEENKKINIISNESIFTQIEEQTLFMKKDTSQLFDSNIPLIDGECAFNFDRPSNDLKLNADEDINIKSEPSKNIMLIDGKISSSCKTDQSLEQNATLPIKSDINTNNAVSRSLEARKRSGKPTKIVLRNVEKYKINIFQDSALIFTDPEYERRTLKSYNYDEFMRSISDKSDKIKQDYDLVKSEFKSYFKAKRLEAEEIEDHESEFDSDDSEYEIRQFQKRCKKRLRLLVGEMKEKYKKEEEEEYDLLNEKELLRRLNLLSEWRHFEAKSQEILEKEKAKIQKQNEVKQNKDSSQEDA